MLSFGYGEIATRYMLPLALILMPPLRHRWLDASRYYVARGARVPRRQRAIATRVVMRWTER